MQLMNRTRGPAWRLQFNRANRALRAIRTMLGRVIRDIGRRIRGETELEAAFALPRSLARQVHAQDRRQRGRKIYSLHAPETEASARATPTSHTSSASRSRWQHRSCAVRAASSSPM